MWSTYTPASPQYSVRYDARAWFKIWDVVEVRIDSVNKKHYRVIKSFMYNSDADSFCGRLNM